MSVDHRIYFFSNYFLRAYQILSTVLGAGDEAMTKQTSLQTNKIKIKNSAFNTSSLPSDRFQGATIVFLYKQKVNRKKCVMSEIMGCRLGWEL